MSIHKDNVNDETKARILTQGEFEEHIRNYFARLTKQLEDLTRQIQGTSTAHQPNLSLRALTSSSFSAAGPSPDIVIGGTRTSIDFW